MPCGPPSALRRRAAFLYSGTHEIADTVLPPKRGRDAGESPPRALDTFGYRRRSFLRAAYKTCQHLCASPWPERRQRHGHFPGELDFTLDERGGSRLRPRRPGWPTKYRYHRRQPAEAGGRNRRLYRLGLRHRRDSLSGQPCGSRCGSFRRPHLGIVQSQVSPCF
jgi:hypothetical protein